MIMNKDKIIKDLKERNDKLENQRRQFEFRLYHEQHIVEEKDKEIQRLNKEKSILEKSLKLIWKKDIKIDYEKLDKANKDIEKELKGVK